MPKVEYTKSKGLQQKKSGASDTDLFVVSGAAIQPSVVEIQRQLVTVADPGKTGAQLNGLHFVVFDSAQKNIVYFSSTDNAAPVSNANGSSAVAAGASEPLSIAMSRESSPVKLVDKPMLY